MTLNRFWQLDRHPVGTAFAGALYGIDAYNQPGVELGKQFTYGIFGRPGFEADRDRFQQLAQPDPSCVV